MTIRAVLHRTMIVASVLLGLNAIAPFVAPAAAQDPFQMLIERSYGGGPSNPGNARGLFGGGGFGYVVTNPDSLNEPPPRARTTITVRPHATPKADGGGKFCVRLCDGRYFSVAGDSDTASSTCQAQCPESATAIYSGRTIEDARDKHGKLYTDMRRAFGFRHGVDAQCTCKKNTPLGLAKVALDTDPTLRVNDIVILDDGAHFVTGFSGTGASRRATFTAAAKAHGQARELKRELSKLEVQKHTIGKVKLAGPVAKPTASQRVRAGREASLQRITR